MNGIPWYRAFESLAARGDLSGLSPAEKARYYVAVCEELGLNPHLQPFAYLRLNGKEVLYATRGATDQLAALHRLNRELVDGPKVIDLAGTKLVYAVCKVTLPNGRFETATATVALTDPVNAMMKCETRAKRRATLSILGLAPLDEAVPASRVEGFTVLSAEELDAAMQEMHAPHAPTSPSDGDGGDTGGNPSPASPEAASAATTEAPVSTDGPARLLGLAFAKLPATPDGARAVARTWWAHRDAFVEADVVDEGEGVVFAALRARGVTDVEAFLTETRAAKPARKSLVRARRPEGGIAVRAVGT